MVPFHTVMEGRPFLPRLAVIAAVALLYIVAGKGALTFASVHESASPVWPPTGIALAAFLVLGYRVWPAILIGAFVVNVMTAGSVVTSSGIALGNTLEGLLGAGLVRRFAGGDRVFERAWDIFRFAVLAGLGATTISATVGVGSLALTGYARWEDAPAIWLTWWLGDVAGALVVAPVLVLWARDQTLGRLRSRLLEAAALVLAIILIGLVVFGGFLPLGLRNYPLAFLTIPFLLWAAFRFGQREAATVIALLSGLAIRGTVNDVGPFAGHAPNESLLLLQAFLGTMAMTALPVAALVWEHRRLEHEERDRLQAATATRSHLTAIVEGSDDAIVSKTVNGVITSWNPAAEKMFGYTEAEAIGQHITLIIPEERRAEEDDVIARILRGQTVDHFETVRRAKNGRRLNISLTVSPMKGADGRIIGASKIARDITERKVAEEERAQLLQREQAARALAEDASRAKDEFLATVSHELRTPLNAMLGWVRMLRSGTLEEAANRHALEVIERNAYAQSQLISDLLDVSRIISGKMALNVRPVELHSIIEAAVDTVRPSAAAKRIAISLALDPEVGPFNGDPDRLQQVVWNLISNAVKFTPAGGRVAVVLERRDEMARIAIRDTGKGIQPEFIPHLFERFRQAESGITRTHGGLGLGLAIVRHLVELHGGTVRADSAGEGKGAEVIVELPLHRPLDGVVRGAPPAMRPPLPIKDQSLHGVRVLVVDDDRDTCELVSTILAQRGAEPTSATSVREALGRFEERRPDVIVCDIAMPGEDGYSFIQHIRERGPQQGGAVPALALTAYVKREDYDRAIAAGFQRHLAKPVDPVGFAQVVAELCGRRVASHS